LSRCYAILLAVVLAMGGCASSQSTPTGSGAGAQPTLNSSADPGIASPGPETPTANPQDPVASDPVVARVGEHPVMQAQMLQPLYEAYGLNLLLKLCQLEIVQAEAQKHGLTVTPEDLSHELDVTMKQMVPDAEATDYPALLDQFLASQHISRQEFDLVMQINAHLRRLAGLQAVTVFTDAQLLEAFNLLYGETVKVRHIQLNNLQEVGEARRRLAAGEPFERVARDLSRHKMSAQLGGELPAFSRETKVFPQSFIDAAFLLKAGEISDPVKSDDFYHLIKLEARFAPKAVKFDEMKEIVRQTLIERWLEQKVFQLKETVRQEAEASLVIVDPILKRRFEEEKARALQAKEAEDRQRKELPKIKRTSKPETEAVSPATGTITPATDTVSPATAPVEGPDAALIPRGPDGVPPSSDEATGPPDATTPLTPASTQEGLRPPATMPAK